MRGEIADLLTASVSSKSKPIIFFMISSYSDYFTSKKSFLPFLIKLVSVNGISPAIFAPLTLIALF